MDISNGEVSHLFIIKDNICKMIGDFTLQAECSSTFTSCGKWKYDRRNIVSIHLSMRDSC